MPLTDIWANPSPGSSLSDLWGGGGAPQPMTPEERLRAFQERYPGAMPGLNEKSLYGPEKPVQQQDPAQVVGPMGRPDMMMLDPYVVRDAPRMGETGTGMASRSAEGVMGLAELPLLAGMAGGLPLQAQAGAGMNPEIAQMEEDIRRGGVAAAQALTPDFIEAPREAIRENYQRIREYEIEEGLEAGKSPVRVASEDYLKDLFSMTAGDPTNWVGLGGASRAGRAIAQESGEVGARAGARRAVVDALEELATPSLAIRPSREVAQRAARVVDTTPPDSGVIRTVSALDETGGPVGSMTFSVEPDGGFRVMDVETSGRGTGGMRAMYREAREISGGPHRGSVAQTDEGAAAVARLRETDPDLFAPQGSTLLATWEEGKFRPPDQPFQYTAGTSGPSAENLNVLEEAMSAPATARQRRTDLPLSTLKERPEYAQALAGMTEEDFLKLKPGTALNEEEFIALQGLLRGKGEQLDAARAAMKTGLGGDEAESAFARIQDEYVRLAQVDMGGRAVWGRTGQAMQTLRKAIRDPEDLRIYLRRQFGEKLSKEDLDLLTTLDLDNAEEVAEFFRRVDKPKFWEYPKAIFYNSILAALGTVGRNVGGTVSHAASYIPVRALAAQIDRPLAKAHGRPRAYYTREILPALAAAPQGFLDGARTAVEVLKRGSASVKFERPRNPFMHLENPIARKVLGTATDTSTRILEGTDAVMVTSIFQAERKARSVRKALQEGHSGKALDAAAARYMDDEDIVAAAMREAEKITFRDPGGPITKTLQDWLHKIPGSWMFVPFVRIGGRLMKAGFEFTPIYGGVKGVAKAIKGEPEAAELLAKATIGTAIMGYTWAKAEAGDVVGSFANMSPAERAQAYEEGKKPFSMRLGDNWYPLSQMEPLAAPFALTVVAHETWGDDQVAAEEKLSGAMMGLARNRLDASFLSGLSDLLQNIYYQEAGGGMEMASRTGVAFANPYSGLSRSIANAMDPRIVEADGFVEELQATIPGLKENLPAKLDRFGRPIERTLAEALGPTGTPFVPSPVTKDPVTLELGRLGYGLGFPGATNRGIKMTDEERRELLEMIGPATYQVLSRAIASPQWALLSDTEKMDLIDDAVQGIRGAGREAILPGVVQRYVREQGAKP